MDLGVDAQRLLEAIDGVAYLVDAEGIVRAIGTGAWDQFAEANDAAGLTATSVTGRSLFAGMAGARVREICRRLHYDVCVARRPAISYEFRCDAPGVERRMQMSVRPVIGASGVVLALYQSQMLVEAPRLPLGLLSPERRVHSTVDASAFPIVGLCSFCHAVAWPISAAEEDRNWIGIDDYYRRGGEKNVQVSHGICPACVARLVGE